jgi:hypothetical protein
VRVAWTRGLALHGPPPSELLPAVPRADYLDSILADVAWGAERIDENPVYLILNLCRISAYVREGLVCSKDEGAAWALRELPPEERPVVAAALATYRGEQPAFHGVGRPELLRFVEERTARIKEDAAG